MKEHLKNKFLARWVNDDLTNKEDLDFKNSADYQEFKKIAELSKKLRTPVYDKNTAFTEILDKRNTKPKIKPLRSRYLIYKIAASVLILLGSFYLLKPSKTLYKSKVGEQLVFSLPDNSKVILNSNSSLEFRTKKWNKNKEVELQGEAFFNVAKGSLFSVKTDNATVHVLGTRFNVKSNGKYFETQCYSGKVKVENLNINNQTVLSRGNAYRIEANSYNSHNFKASEPSWLQGESTFKNAPFEEVLIALKNQFGLTFSYNKEKYLTERFTGSFIHNDIDTSLQMVFSAMEIEYIKQGKKIILKE